MREIKFRFWNKEQKQMQYPFEAKYFDFKPEGLNIDDKLFYIKTYEDKCEIMQYTGLKDKNGKEIYFHDLVSIKGISTTTGKVGKILQVEDWHDVVCNYGIENALDAGLDVEVIGNIYENPELLNK